MPTENGTQKGYTIKFPSTTRDDGSPSDDILHDCRRILLLIDDERHLIAQKLYASVTSRLQEHPGKDPKPLKFHPSNVLKRKKLKKVASSQEEDYITILQFLDAHREILEILEVRPLTVAQFTVNIARNTHKLQIYVERRKRLNCSREREMNYRRTMPGSYRKLCLV